MQLLLHSLDAEDAKAKIPAPKQAPKIINYFCNCLVCLGKKFANDLIERKFYTLFSHQNINDIISN